MMAGVTSTGFVSKTVSEVQTDTEAAVREVYGPKANVDARSRVGQFIGVLSEAVATLWQLAEAVAAALDPNSATGVLLDNISALTGTTRQAATKTAVTLTAIGTNGTVIAAGKRAGVTGTSTIFETLAGATITTASDWSATAYSKGATVKNDGSIWRALSAGTATTAPTGVATFTDGALVWEWLGLGSAFVDVAAEATETGPLAAFAQSVTTILTPVAGWALVTNALDANVGRNDETDTELRARRSSEVAAQGTSPLPAIRGEVLQVVGVTSVSVFENVTDITVDGMPPHSFEVLVEGGDDADIAQVILNAKAGGIATTGNVTTTGVTSDAVTRSVSFSRPTSVDIWVKVVGLVKDPGVYPLDGDERVKDVIATWGDAQALGRDVVAAAISAQIFAGVPGVLDVPSVLIGTANPPVSSATIAMTLRQRAAYDTSRISVTSTDGVP